MNDVTFLFLPGSEFKEYVVEILAHVWFELCFDVFSKKLSFSEAGNVTELSQTWLTCPFILQFRLIFIDKIWHKRDQ